MAGIDYAYRAAEIVRDAGGTIVGRTRLQKIGFFLEAAGLGSGFPFRYKHYGPYSEVLASAAQHAAALHLINEQESVANWGGLYSIFTSKIAGNPDPARIRFLELMRDADAVELELAATAVYLATERWADPWGETQRRKPDKASGGRLDRARSLYSKLSAIPTPHRLPAV
jgi:hypothetical protein